MKSPISLLVNMGHCMSKVRVMPNGNMDVLTISKFIDQGILPPEVANTLDCQPGARNSLPPVKDDPDRPSPVPPPRRRKKRRKKSPPNNGGPGGYVEVVRTVAPTSLNENDDNNNTTADYGEGDGRRLQGEDESVSQQMLDNIDAAIADSGTGTLNGGIRISMERLKQLRSSFGHLRKDATFKKHMKQYGVIYEDSMEDCDDPYINQSGMTSIDQSFTDEFDDSEEDAVFMDSTLNRPLCSSHREMGGSMYFDIMDR